MAIGLLTLALLGTLGLAATVFFGYRLPVADRRKTTVTISGLSAGA